MMKPLSFDYFKCFFTFKFGEPSGARTRHHLIKSNVAEIRCCGKLVKLESDKKLFGF